MHQPPHMRAEKRLNVQQYLDLQLIVSNQFYMRHKVHEIDANRTYHNSEKSNNITQHFIPERI